MNKIKNTPYRERPDDTLSRPEKEQVKAHLIEHCAIESIDITQLAISKEFTLEFAEWMGSRDHLWRGLGDLDEFFKSKLGRSLDTHLRNLTGKRAFFLKDDIKKRAAELVLSEETESEPEEPA